MEVSHLQVKVTSEGVDKVSRQLGGLGNSANNAEVKVTKLTDTITKLIGLQGKLGAVQQAATSQAQSQANVFSNLHTVMGQVAANMAGITAATNALANAMQNVTAHTNNTAAALQRKSHWGNVATSTLKAMATATSVYMGMNLAKSIVESADSWQLMNAKLLVATKTQNNANRAQQEIYETAQKTRSPLEETAKLWTRLVGPMQRMGKTGDDVTRVVQSVSTAMKLSGATAAEQASAMLQLSQSFNAGRLNGAEFNAVAEAAPLILDAVAKQMGKTRAELKKLGSDGKITGDVLVAAMMNVGPEWDKQFAKLPITFDDAMTVLKNRWKKEIGEMGMDTGFNQKLVEGVKVLENMIPAIARGLGEAFVGLMGWLDKNKEKLGQIWDQIVGLGKDIWGIVEGFFRMMGVIGGAGENVSVLAAGIFGVRLALAAIVDVVKLIAGSFIAVGADIYEFFLMPIAGVAKLLTSINETLAGMNEAAAKVSRAAGNNYYADKQEEAAKSQRANAKAIDDFMMSAVSMGQKARDIQADLTEGWRTGNTEVQKVLDSTNKLAESASKKKTPWEGGMAGGAAEPGLPDEKALKKAQQALDKYQKAYDALNNKIKEQIELNDRLAKYGLDYDKMGEGAKARIKYETELQKLQRDGGSQLEKDRVMILLMQATELEGWEKEVEHRKERLQLQKTEEDQAKSKLKTLEEEAAQMEYKVKTFGMAKGAVEALELATAKQKVTEMLNVGPLSEHEQKILTLLQAQIAARERLANAGEDLGALETAKKLDDMLDSSKAVKFGNDFKEAFGKVGKSIGTVVDAFEKMKQRQDKTNKMREEYNKLTKDDGKNAERLAKIQQLEAMNTIDSYADMAGAAKNFFDEKSKGYQIMEAAEKTFRAFQMAMQLEAFARESGLITAITGIFVANKAAEVAAEEATVAPTIAANLAKQASNAVTALTSALTAPWPANFVSFAIVAGMLAALGVAFSGGGGSGTAPTTNTGTGTVLGDPSAKSESIANSIDNLSEIDRTTMRYSAQMAASLDNIEASIGGVTNLVLRTGGGTTSGSQFGVATGTVRNQGDPLLNMTGNAGWLDGGLAILKASDKLFNAIDKVTSGMLGKLQGLWGKTSTDITAAGVYIDGRLSDLQRGLGMSSFADVKVTSSSMFGLKKDTSYQTLFAGLDPQLANQFGLILTNMVDAVTLAGKQLGVPATQIEQTLNNLSLSLGRIDLRGLTGDQIQERLMAVFGAAGDTIARAVIPGFDAFQQVGEGYLETVVRVSTGVEQATYELDKLGIAAISVGQIINKQGDVGAEIVRQSLLLVEAGTGIGEIVQTLSGTAEDIASTYGVLIALRRAMDDVGLGNNLGMDAIRAAGGLSQLQDAVEAYTEGFFSDAERQAIQTQNMTEDFAKLGLAMPATRAAFRSLVESLQASGQDSLAMKVLLLAGAFSDLKDEAEQAAEAAVEKARSDLTDAYNKEKDAINSVKEKFESFADTMREFKSSLLTGDLSTLTNSEKYATLKGQYESTYAAAMSGDQNAIDKFQSIANEFLTFSREFNASGDQYIADFNAVMAASTALEAFAEGQATQAEQQLSLLEQQVSGLIEINESVLTVAQAITALTGLLGGDAQSFVPTPTTINGGFIEDRAYQTDTQIPRAQAQDALIVEVQGLRAQIASLQEQQAGETAALIASNYDANAANADSINDAANSSAYSERTQVAIA